MLMLCEVRPPTSMENCSITSSLFAGEVKVSAAPQFPFVKKKDPLCLKGCRPPRSLSRTGTGAPTAFPTLIVPVTAVVPWAVVGTGFPPVLFTVTLVVGLATVTFGALATLTLGVFWIVVGTGLPLAFCTVTVRNCAKAKMEESKSAALIAALIAKLERSMGPISLSGCGSG